MTKPKRGGTPQADHEAIAAYARKHKGFWVKVNVYRSLYVARSMCSTIRGGRSNANISAYKPAGAFEAKYEMHEDGWQVYTQYIGRPK